MGESDKGDGELGRCKYSLQNELLRLLRKSPLREIIPIGGDDMGDACDDSGNPVKFRGGI